MQARELIEGISEAVVGRLTRLGRYNTRDIYREHGNLARPWLTWGNLVNLNPNGPSVGTIGAEQQITNLGTTQLLNVHYDMPTTWHSRVVFDFTMPSGETNEITVSYTLFHGVGQARVAILRTFTVGAPYAQVVDDQVFPAEGIQMQAAIVSYTASAAGAFNVAVQALVAPKVA